MFMEAYMALDRFASELVRLIKGILALSHARIHCTHFHHIIGVLLALGSS